MGAIGLGHRVQGLTPGVHGTTFGGNPLACAAALATLGVIEAEGLVARAEENGRYFRERLSEINSPLIREVRGQGLLVGIELRVRAMDLVRALMDRGVLTLTAGPTVLRMLPPLVISRAELDSVVEAIRASLLTLSI
ncbi:MAG: aminotransferase class III-fold pyridoxal phosphate-dependent enzyme, partial [Anaerolineales bacterium]|nr:aminotransferase class III-fold pyridoxal phosphate-dependent enzyme [Anaerolineales bacterium]